MSKYRRSPTFETISVVSGVDQVAIVAMETAQLHGSKPI